MSKAVRGFASSNGDGTWDVVCITDTGERVISGIRRSQREAEQVARFVVYLHKTTAARFGPGIRR